MLTRDEFQSVYEYGPDATFALFTAMQEQLAALSVRVAELEARANKDSHNSSKPPSSDGLAKKPVSLRPHTGRKPGGQKGHPGRTLAFADVPDVVETYAPAFCTGCQADLTEVPGRQAERRQVFDLPPLRLVVTEHRVERKMCRRCGQVTAAVFPASVRQAVQYGPQVQALSVYLLTAHLLPVARVANLFADLFAQPLSPGTLNRWQQNAAQRLEGVSEIIRAGLRRAEVAHFDETGLRVAGRLHWLHVACTNTLTAYAVSPKRGQDGMNAAGILPDFAGTAVHDGWASYQGYHCRHALCNAHHLRELVSVFEQSGQTWARDLIALLREAKQTVEDAQAQSQTGLPPDVVAALTRRYERLVQKGLAQNPAAEPTPGKKGKPRQSVARNLLARLHRFARETLAFVSDFAVPFDNNQAERDVRMVKVQQKVSGCFRTRPGADAFCRVRGYLSTMRKQGQPLLLALQHVFAGQPLCPHI